MEHSEQSTPSFSFPDMEHEIIDFWNKHDVFQESLRRTKDKQPYVFFDGPPFATGLPHHGNLVASVIKDVIPRYWTMKGRYVERRFGWDCHGLPIEHEIDKKLGISAHEALQRYGVAGYNDECRKIVGRYMEQWQSIINRFGRWVDFDDQYRTMDPWFMESVWWVLKQLWVKDLVYRGMKVMPVSVELQTPLSNFEATSNYKDVQDPAITVLFKLSDEDAYVAAWTTTPWTLPSNLALCVGADIDYVCARDIETGRNIYLAESRYGYYRERMSLEVTKRLKGIELEGMSYEPMFPYFAKHRDDGAFQIFCDDYITVDEGTGVVHQAPAFGEDDFRIAQEHDMKAFVCPVSMDGVFTEEVSDFKGKFVKTADKDIIAYLKAKDVLLEHTTIQHSYPYCYRSDTPLIYRAVPSWFVRVSDLRDRMVKTNEKIRWVPSNIRDGRFGNWLANANDWAISRNRVWGTPLPIWENDITGEFICIGSRDELEEYTGVRPGDLHREFVDPLTFSISGQEGTYRRIEEVLDCWFESGSMPYAQQHYPFENKEKFESGFPADFIAEGLDQTRGWFYTLVALSTALYDEPAFKNVVVNGLVLANDGKKMSKRLKNYTDPDLLMDRYGADALRLYLINSGLVKAEEQRFSDDGVKAMVRRALLPWYNAFSFLRMYAEIDHWSPANLNRNSDNILDRWLLSRLQTLKSEVAYEMEQYHLYNVVPKLFDFIDNLRDWYIRLNRSRFWFEGMTKDKNDAFSALYIAVLELSQVMAPCAPFLSEFVYGELLKFDPNQEVSSVHLCDYPEAEAELRDADLEEAVRRMQSVILLGRKRREDGKINLRTPLAELTIIHQDREMLGDLRKLDSYIKSELNVKAVLYDENESDYITRYAKPNFPVLGKRLGKRMREFQKLFSELSVDELAAFQENGSIEISGETFTTEEIQIFRDAKSNKDVITDRNISIQLDCDTDETLRLEGLAREIVHRIQLARRNQGFLVTDRIRISYNGSERVLAALDQFGDYIARETLAVEIKLNDENDFEETVHEESLSFGLNVVNG